MDRNFSRGVMNFAPFVITGNPAFDYFFSIGFMFTLLAISTGLLFKLFKW
jgi:hypothetical protein